ncbi:mobilization protein [gut metagenome]|uniref:Mobilization protein n=1 Tax=gut metagenome TaxID=749906 RepID=J9G6P8_9ZZZZ
MNHETGKSRKLNDEDMATMQTLASDILLMERGQAKAVTGKEHLERNVFIIKKTKSRTATYRGNQARQGATGKPCRAGTQTGKSRDTHRQTQKCSYRYSHCHN